MVKRNPHFLKLSESYLFPEVSRRAKLFKEKNPLAELISLSIGDTSEPLTSSAVEGLIKQTAQMGRREGYRGYGPEQGDRALREKIAQVFYANRLSADEIFISDGAKCDIGRFQLLFGQEVTIGVQDPAYPVYVDTHIAIGGKPIAYLPCLPENGFFPAVSSLPKVDLLYICSPNNPTGSVATREQLTALVAWAKVNKAMIIFDSAYSGFIQDPTLPRSIYEIEGAEEVAIEVSSFSKLIGFTGVRLGWSVVPKKLCFEEGHSVHKDFTRLVTTFFNGASVLSQAGGLAALTPKGLVEMRQMLDFYLENARLIKQALENKRLPIYGGVNAPYLWVDCGDTPSWETFQILLEKAGLITTPGSGFGRQGEGFIRFSAFGSREHILNAIKRIEEKWPL